MSLFGNLSPASRRSALALILLGVLVASTAWAWWLMRQSAVMPTGEQWYLAIDEQNQPIGWKAVRRTEGGRLGLQGYEVIAVGPSVSWSTWQLDPDATVGRYRSSVPFEQTARGLIYRDTNIIFTGQQVAIAQTFRDQAGRAASGKTVTHPVGDDYIAEGTLRTRIIQAAQTGEPFTGAIVLDDQLALIQLHLIPQTQTQGADDATAVDVLYGPRDAPLSVITYHVAADGVISLIEQRLEGRLLQFRLADPSEVRRHFPRAMTMRTRLLHQHGFED